jgi:hypothetical protein
MTTPIPLFELPEPLAATPADSRPKQLRIMHERHGMAENGQVCGQCRHLVRGKYHNKTYFKCGLFVPWTHGPGTDWRKGWPACGKWTERT